MRLFSVRLPWHKALEACVQRLPDRFSVGFKLAFARADHAGLHFHAQVFGLLIEFSVYDRRHWNYDKDRHVTRSLERIPRATTPLHGQENHTSEPPNPGTPHRAASTGGTLVT